MFHGKPIPSLGELRIVWKLSNLGACIELHVRQRLLNKIRIRTKRAAQVPTGWLCNVESQALFNSHTSAAAALEKRYMR